MVDRGEQLLRMHRIAKRCRAGLIRFSVYIPSLDACSSQDCRVAVWPVISPIVGIGIAGGADSSLRAATKLTHRNHQRIIEHPPFIEVLDQCCQTRVEHRSRLCLHPFRQIDMNIPGVIVGVGDLRPDHLDNAGPRFDQSAS